MRERERDREIFPSAGLPPNWAQMTELSPFEARSQDLPTGVRMGAGAQTLEPSFASLPVHKPGVASLVETWAQIWYPYPYAERITY